MKNLLIISGFITAGVVFTACTSAGGNNPGDVYAPDMNYSRAYEANNYNNLPEDHDLKSRGVTYTGLPVAGTVARGDVYSFPFPAGDSGYVQAANYRSPMDTVALTDAQRKEAERLYLINCGICHGTALDGNGPLWKGGDGPYPVAPRNLKDAYSLALSDGQMYHAITFGKGQMGSYASQVHPEQRWWIIKYIREKQGGATPATGGAAAGADTTAAVGTGAAAGTDTTANR